jgi:hypothetical protein
VCEVSKLSFEDRWDIEGRMGEELVEVKGRPRRDSREDRRVDNADSCVVSDGEYCKV